MKTKKMIAVIGVCEGYGHNNEGGKEEKTFNKLYIQTAGDVFASCGIYVSAVSKETRTLYNTEWGCPEDGEITYELSATANPEFVKDMVAWKAACLEVVSKLKEKLNQTTVTVEFMDVDILYIK